MDYQPEVAAPISGGGFSNVFTRPLYQQQALPTFLQNIGDLNQGFYKWACICQLIFPMLNYNCAALMAAVSLTFLRRRKVSRYFGMVMKSTHLAQAARHLSVYSSLHLAGPHLRTPLTAMCRSSRQLLRFLMTIDLLSVSPHWAFSTHGCMVKPARASRISYMGGTRAA
jgi:hypothetical protein